MSVLKNPADEQHLKHWSDKVERNARMQHPRDAGCRVQKLFNTVPQSGCFPDIWCKGLISPIHKSGDESDPNKYQGICVSRCLGKLFCSISK